MAAAARAAHLIVDGAPTIFTDPLAEVLLGEQAETLLSYHRNHGNHLVLAGARTQVTLRSRFTEGRVADAAARGVGQYVILGAGLDSFAYRNGSDGSDGSPMTVFEVDHPASQEWKRACLAEAGVTIGDNVAHVPVNLETEALLEPLIRAGFDTSRPAVVGWLGVTMYLTRPAIAATLATIGSLAPGTEIVTDYKLTPELRDERGQTYVDLVAPNSAERGEPWLSFFTPDDMSQLLAEHGFTGIQHLRQRDWSDELWRRDDALCPTDLSVLICATTGQSMSGGG